MNVYAWLFLLFGLIAVVFIAIIVEHRREARRRREAVAKREVAAYPVQQYDLNPHLDREAYARSLALALLTDRQRRRILEGDWAGRTDS